MTEVANTPHELVVSRSVALHAPGAGVSNAEWGIAVEAPVQITVDDVPFAVLMATPADLHDLAVGLLLTEGIVDDPDQVSSLDATAYLGEFAVHVSTSTGVGVRTSRRLVSPSGCGLCGTESLAALEARTRPVRAAVVRHLNDEAVRRAVAALPSHQPLNAACRSVHAAAWCTPAGDIAVVREDVGRHNALDKLVGALARAGRLLEDGFVLMSSRCSYELVHKAAFTSARALVTVSAPTTMAIAWARSLALPLVSLLQRGAQVTVVHHPLDEPPHAR